MDRLFLLVVGSLIALLLVNQGVAGKRGWILRRGVYLGLQAVNGLAMVALAWVPLSDRGDGSSHTLIRVLLILMMVRRVVETARRRNMEMRRREGDVSVAYDGGEAGMEEDEDGRPPS